MCACKTSISSAGIIRIEAQSKPNRSPIEEEAEANRGMVLVAYAGPVRPAAALRDSVLCLPTDIHSLFVNKPSSSSSSFSSSCRASRVSLLAPNEHSPRTCTAGSVAPSSARCALVEDDCTLLPQYRSQEG